MSLLPFIHEAPLAQFLGRPDSLVAGEVIPLTRQEIVGLLTTEDKEVETALFAYADACTGECWQ